MDINLLRSKMALKGDYDIICLVVVTNLSYQAITKRCNGEVEWKQSEIKAIASYYELTMEEVSKIFNLVEVE